MDEPEVEAARETDEVQRFWEVARFHARLNVAPSYFGPTTLEVVPPPTFRLGDTAEESDDELARLVAEGETTLHTPAGAFASPDEHPQPGSLGIVLDGQDRPRALVTTTDVIVSGDTVTEHLKVLHSA